MDSKKVDSARQSKNDRIKRETLLLYQSLPQNKDERIKRTDVRDKVIELNYPFFGYIANTTFINNRSVSYEDKLQSAVMHFCECWWWYQWDGDETHKGYRKDLSFTVFFKPRIGEMIERELNEVKYSIRRSLCMEVGAQIGKHWGKVHYEDLSDPRVHLSPDKMNSLKAIFGTLYVADIADHEMFIEADPVLPESEFEKSAQFTEFDSIVELLIHDMIMLESDLSDAELRHMSEMYQIDLDDLKKSLPLAKEILYKRLKSSLDQRDMFY